MATKYLDPGSEVPSEQPGGRIRANAGDSGPPDCIHFVGSLSPRETGSVEAMVSVGHEEGRPMPHVLMRRAGVPQYLPCPYQ